MFTKFDRHYKKDLKMVLVGLIILVIQHSGYAQDYKALRVGLYSGITAHSLNPSYHRSNKIKWDLHLVGGGLDISNNYFHFDNKSGIGLLSSINETVEAAEGLEQIEDIAAALDLSFTTTGNTRAHIDMEVNGPGFILNLPQHSIGVFTKVSVLGHMNDLPNYTEAMNIADTPYEEAFTFPEADIALMSLSQMGISLSTSTPVADYSLLHYGVNIKKYGSTDLVFASSHQYTDGIKKVDSLLLINAELEGAFFSNYSYDIESQSSDYDTQINGSGWGLDLGFIYELRRNSYESSSLKLGVSVADLGYLKYSNGHYHHFTINDGFIIEQDFLDESIPDELNKILDIDDKEYLNQSIEKSFWAPATLNIMGEYAYNEKLLFNLSARENIPGLSPVQRAAYISATAQYNMKWIGYTLPISLYNHRVLRMGSALRLGPLTIGTDNLLPLIIPHDLKAANLYFSISINSSMLDFLSPRSKNPKRLNRNKNNVKCYYFDN